MDTKKVIAQALEVSVATKALEFGENILDRVPGLFNKFFPGQKAIVFADKITWKVAGERVFYELAKAGVPATTFIITDDRFHPDWKYVEMVDKVIEDEKGILIAVGAGVINDLAKLGSFRHNQQYICVATTASVDGYTSSSAIVNDERGAKINIKSNAPLVIVADSKVLGSAPWFLSAAGYADLAAKVTSGAEWMIADLFGTEPIDPPSWHITQDSLKDMLDDPEGVRNGKPEAIEKLFLGLTLAGIGMEVAGSSRPASCAEHLYGHYWDMTHHTNNGRPVSHGFQVAIGELTLCAFFDALFEMDLSKLDVDKCVEAWPSLEEEQERAKKIYADFPVLQAQVWSFEKMRDMFRRAGAPTTPEEIGATREDLRKITDYVQLMRWRINLLDLAKRGCFYDELMDKVFGKGGVWEIKK